jgi:hypothetical protein
MTFTIHTDVSPAEAELILGPYYEVLQEHFADSGLTLVRKTRLRCKRDIRNTERHFAGCTDSGLTIYAAPEMVELPPDVVSGILAHELGHAADFLYPGEFQLREERVRRIRPDKYQLAGWKKRDPDSVEMVADRIAEKYLGTPIGYRGPCYLQSLGLEGHSRPAGLR